jgi:hypothetical protein
MIFNIYLIIQLIKNLRIFFNHKIFNFKKIKSLNNADKP